MSVLPQDVRLQLDVPDPSHLATDWKQDGLARLHPYMLKHQDVYSRNTIPICLRGVRSLQYERVLWKAYMWLVSDAISSDSGIADTLELLRLAWNRHWGGASGLEHHALMLWMRWALETMHATIRSESKARAVCRGSVEANRFAFSVKTQLLHRHWMPGHAHRYNLATTDVV